MFDPLTFAKRSLKTFFQTIPSKWIKLSDEYEEPRKICDQLLKNYSKQKKDLSKLLRVKNGVINNAPITYWKYMYIIIIIIIIKLNYYLKKVVR